MTYSPSPTFPKPSNSGSLSGRAGGFIRNFKLLNAFTGAYLLSPTLLHLLPELYHVHDGMAHDDRLLIGALILIGFFIQFALDVISMGVEHGHSHHFHGRMPFGVVAGLCLHAFLEAMALGNRQTSYDPQSRQLLLVSIIIHNYPVSIALLGMLASGHTVLANYSRELMAIVIGILMHIPTTIRFEASDAHRFNLTKLLVIVVGTALGVASVLFH